MKGLAVNSREKTVQDFSALCKYLIINEITIIKRPVTPGVAGSSLVRTARMEFSHG